MTKAFPEIAMIAALAGSKKTLGNKGELVAVISDDLKNRFRALTLGHAIIMGRKTFQSIGKPLPGRENFVITRDANFQAPGAVVCSNLDEAITKASEWEMKNPLEQKQIFIIGGAEIYTQGLPLTDKLYLTLIEKEVNGDAFFPDYSDFKKVIKHEDRVDEKTGLNYSWVDLEK